MKRMPLASIITGLGGIFLVLAVLSGLSVFRQFKEEAVMDEYKDLILKDNIQVVDLINWIDQNIESVPQEKAGEMVLELERVQQAALLEWQAKFENESVQTVLADLYLQNRTIENLNGLKDETVERIVAETLRNGFKVETAEGMFFPVLDYTTYGKYRDKVSPDLAEYFEIMAVESEQMPAKDAALVIGWDEVLNRARRQEAFLKQYPSSSQAGAVRQLLKRYVTFTLFGSNNTPLFSYETGKMNAKAKTAFSQKSWQTEDGAFSALISQYLKVLEENNFQLTTAVDNYRQKTADAF